MYTIVNFSPALQPQINALLSQVQEEFSEKFDTAETKSVTELVAEGSKFWVAVDGSLVAGIIGLAFFDRTTVVIRRMFVRKEYRGENKKLSLSLLQIALEEAKKQGVTRVYLGTMSQMLAAQRFYEKKGFSRIGKSDLPPGLKLSEVDTVFYIKTLSDAQT